LIKGEGTQMGRIIDWMDLIDLNFSHRR